MMKLFVVLWTSPIRLYKDPCGLTHNCSKCTLLLMSVEFNNFVIILTILNYQIEQKGF